jgi:TPR repeat protein
MNAVGYKYQFGTGVAPDIGTAIDWYCRAVAQGNPRALNNLAILLDDGHGVARDVAQARDLWRQAAERGNTNSALNLGVSFATSGNTSEALLWLRRAAQAGQPAAQKILRDNGYNDAFPPPFDPTAMMIIQPGDQPAGHARICGAPTS